MDDSPPQRALQMAHPAAYAGVLRAPPETHADSIRGHLLAIGTALPQQADGVMIMVHQPQDPDGSFGIDVHLSGPDLYVLNKAIEPHRELFLIRSVARPSEPRAPMFDSLHLPFAVNDVIADTVVEWLQGMWPVVGAPFRGIRVDAADAKDCGTKGVVRLQ